MSKDFSHQNLQGQNFKGQNLAGADFSDANIRGANFTGTILTGANFERSLAGVPPLLSAFLQLVLCGLAGISSFVVVMAMTFAGCFVTPEFVEVNSWFPGILFFILLVGFFSLSWRYSLEIGLGGMVAIALFLSPFVILKPWFFVWDWILTGIWIAVGIAAWVWVLSLAGTTAWILGEATSWGTVGIVAWVAGLVGMVFGSGASFFAGLYSQAWGWVILWALLLYGMIELFAGYVSRQAGLGNHRFSLLHKVAIFWASVGGTSFYQADLTDANFTQALLRQTDFRQANLTRTCWFQSRQLHLANLSKTSLENSKIRELLVSGDGRNQSYVGLNLKGVNLDRANLSRADLREANLNDSTFRSACLTGTNLSRVEAFNTDFSEAKMTGALVTNWHLNEKTSLEKVICEYFYLSRPHTEKYPLNRDLTPGEFTDLFQPAHHLISLHFYRGIDWKIFLYALKKIQESYPKVHFLIQGIEKKGLDILVISLQADQAILASKFQAEFMEIYDAMMSIIADKYEVETLAVYLQENTQILLMIQQFINRTLPKQ
jgi:uncharacterized protein YjbI with pentapeptide repeats